MAAAHRQRRSDQPSHLRCGKRAPAAGLRRAQPHQHRPGLCAHPAGDAGHRPPAEPGGPGALPGDAGGGAPVWRPDDAPATPPTGGPGLPQRPDPRGSLRHQRHQDLQPGSHRASGFRWSQSAVPQRGPGPGPHPQHPVSAAGRNFLDQPAVAAGPGQRPAPERSPQHRRPGGADPVRGAAGVSHRPARLHPQHLPDRPGELGAGGGTAQPQALDRLASDAAGPGPTGPRRHRGQGSDAALRGRAAAGAGGCEFSGGAGRTGGRGGPGGLWQNHPGPGHRPHGECGSRPAVDRWSRYHPPGIGGS